MTFRSGFAALVGRPNAGKSTLTNALVGQKVAITSSRPQTTRHTIRGIVHHDDAQLVLVDTPGLHRPRTLLGQRLNDLVAETLAEVDLVVFCLPADQKVGPGDRFIAQQLGNLRIGPDGRRRRGPKVVAVVTKADLAGREDLARHLLQVQELGAVVGEWDDIVPVSATSGYQVQALQDVLLGLLPEGPPMYPDGELTDEPELVMVAELIREAALEGLGDELPHSLAVVVEEMEPREDRSDGLVDVRVNLFVERESQKGIVIGKKGVSAARRGNRCAARYLGAARRARVPRPARQGGQGLAARPQAAAPPRVLTGAPVRRRRQRKRVPSATTTPLPDRLTRVPSTSTCRVLGRPHATPWRTWTTPSAGRRPSRTSRAASGPAAVPVAGSSTMPTVGLKNRA